MKTTRFVFAAVALAGTSMAVAQDKRVLTLDDYGDWSRIRSAAISQDGDWFAYQTNPNEGDPTLYMKSLVQDIVHEIPNGSSPEFSPSGEHAFYIVRPGDDSKDKTTTLVLVDLDSGEKTEYKNAVAGEFNEDGDHLLITKSSPRGEKREHSGRDMLLVNLDDAITRHFGSVGQAEFNGESSDMLAYTVDAADMTGNGLYVLDLDSDELLSLASSPHRYTRLTWNEDGELLAALRGDTPEGMALRENELIAFDTTGDLSEPMLTFTIDMADELPDRMIVSENGGLSFSENGDQIYFGIDEQETELTAKMKKDLPNVDVWHWQDDRPQSVQQVQSGRDRRFTYMSAVNVEDGEFVTLADEAMRRVQIVGDGRWAVGIDRTAYHGMVTWGGSPSDVYRIDPTSGERELVAREIGRQLGASPDGRWFIYIEDEHLIAYDMDEDRDYDLTEATGIDFINRDDDHPYELPAYGVGGWTEGRDGTAATVVMNHKFDLYEVALDGSSHRNLTNSMGEDEQIRFRVVRLDRDEDYVDLEGEVLLSAYGEWTKKSGFFELDAGDDPIELVYEDVRFGRPVKAQDDDRVIITRETFEMFPDYYATDTSFSTFDKLTEANPQIEEFAWGRRVLIDYENSDGVPLQATLALPPDYEEGKQYPMLVYFYEKMSQRHHQFSFPAYDDRPHMSTYASDGYLVLMPDVVYEIGTPGDSAVDCVTSAVQEVIDQGYADPDKIGLQGHSWGGYQSSFILTQTDMFACIVTGAPVTNLVSFYNELYKRTGTIQHGIVEVGQVRMGTNPFDDFDLYVDQSPVHNAANISTPFVVLHGTADGAVDWHQGLELYASARRLGKPSVLLSYPDEPHHLGVKANQLDFQERMKDFFDHFCKDEPAPAWWTEGVPYLQKDRMGPKGKRDFDKKDDKKADKADAEKATGASMIAANGDREYRMQTGAAGFNVVRSDSNEDDAEADEPSVNEGGDKPTVKPEDYGQWERMGQRVLSKDGSMLAYTVSRIDRTSELRLKNLSDLDADESVFENGSRPAFTDDAAFLGFLKGVDPDTADKMRKQKKPVQNTLSVVETESGELDEVEDVRSFAFSADGTHLAYSRYPDKGESASTLILRDLETSIETTFGDVADYEWSPEDAILAMVIDTDDNVGNGVRTYDAAFGSFKTLDSSEADYRGMTWHEDLNHLAVMRQQMGEDDEKIDEDERTHDVIAWKNLDDRRPDRFEFTPDEYDIDFHAANRVVEYAGLRWADHAEAVLFGIKARDEMLEISESCEMCQSGECACEEGECQCDHEDGHEHEHADHDKGHKHHGDKKDEKGQDEKKPEPKTLRNTLEEPSNVEVWHADDVDIIPLQKVRQRQFARENHLAVYWLDEDKLVEIENDLTEESRLIEGHRLAVGLDNTPYDDLRKFGPTQYDAYIVDLETGERTQFLEDIKFVFDTSPDGDTVMYQRDGHIWAYHIEDDEHVNLTRGVRTNFTNQEASQLTDEKGPYGIGGWSDDGDQVMLYDRYDIYAFDVNGDEDPIRLTEGAKSQTRYRMITHDPDRDRFFDMDEPIHVSIYGDTTKQWGYGMLNPFVDTGVETLVLEDQNISGLTKAEESDTFVYMSQDFDDPPDLILANGVELADPVQVTEMNPQHEDYAWGTPELIDFTNEYGEPLQGALFYPANYDPKKSYPMITYIYELRSQNLRSYPVPSETSTYNFATFTQEGYFVFQPDIVYRAQNPGVSAVECVVPGVEAVLDQVEQIDPDRVGLVGHSWGAYQTAFIVTQTDLFAAGIAGAPLTNMMSMSMSIYWNSGQTDTWIFHESQGRMDRPFWNDVDTYIANSPIFNIEDMNTPLMICFGDEDGAVDFNQGVELYNAARLAEKDFVMLVYPGENHSVRRRENQVDYHYKILEWFGHYLQGDDAESWITDGKTWQERQKEIKAIRQDK